MTLGCTSLIQLAYCFAKADFLHVTNLESLRLSCCFLKLTTPQFLVESRPLTRTEPVLIALHSKR